MDRRFAQLEIATDPVQMLPRLQARLIRVWKVRPEIRRLVVSRVFPTGDSSITIQYLADIQEPDSSSPRRVIFCGQWFGETGKPPAYLTEETDRVIFIEELDLAVPVFPYDPELRIASLIDNDLVLRSQANLSTAGTDFPWGESRLLACEVLSYRLARRCVLRLTLGIPGPSGVARQVIAKIYRPTKMGRTVQAFSRLESLGFGSASDDGLVVPSVMAIDRERGYLFLKPSVGKSVHDSIGDRSFALGCTAAARILSKLHRQDGSELVRHDWQSEMRLLSPTLELAGSIYPALKDPVSRAFGAAVAEAAVVESCRPAVVHRDFYDKQVMFAQGQPTTLLDLDSLASGDPAMDVGNFLAHLDLRAIQHDDCAATIKSGEAAFLRTYQYPEDDFDERVRWWRGAALLRLSAIYALRPRWHHLAETLIGRSEYVLSLHGNLKGDVLQ